MDSLLDMIPRLYSDTDADGSFGQFVEAADKVQSDLLEASQKLQTIRTPRLAPKEFLPNIGDSLGNPFPFMTPERWQRGNKLEQLAYIYSMRGSKRGIIDAVRYLTGIEIIVETDDEWVWILGVSLLGGTAPLVPTVMYVRDTATSQTYVFYDNQGNLDIRPVPYEANATNGIVLIDAYNGQAYQLSVENGGLTQRPVVASGYNNFLVNNIENGAQYSVSIFQGLLQISSLEKP